VERRDHEVEPREQLVRVVEVTVGADLQLAAVQEAEALRQEYGLDQPMVVQYLRWMKQVLQGRFGMALEWKRPVSEVIGDRLWLTMVVSVSAIFLTWLLALPIGIYSAIRQDTAGDYLTRSFSILMLAVPSFWMGTMVMVFPSIWWGWSPQVNFVAFTVDPVQNLKQMILPALILGTALSAITMRLTRTMMLEVLRQDYIRTAWAKGLSEPLVVIRHALRNALIPVVTLIGLQAPILIGGAVIVEQIFVIPGMGLLLLDAISQRDYPIITGVALIIGLSVMLINLAVDLSYGLLDPKVRYR